MLAKNNPTTAIPKKFPSSNLNFMTNIFKKTDPNFLSKSPIDLSKPVIPLCQRKPSSKCKTSKQSILIPSKESRMNSCGKNLMSVTPNSKSFDVTQKSPTSPSSPEYSKTFFLLNQKKLKTILDKNNLESKTKIGANLQPQKSTDKINKRQSPVKISSARSSPQTNKLKTLFLIKLTNKEKPGQTIPENSLVNQNCIKEKSKNHYLSFKQSKGKFFSKIALKLNKENVQAVDNAHFCGNVSPNSELAKIKQLSHKECIFANFVNNTVSLPHNNKLPAIDVFQNDFAEKLSPGILQANYNLVLSIYATFLQNAVDLDSLLDSYIQTLRHPCFLDISAELNPENELARAFELSLKQQIMLVLFLVPLDVHRASNDQLRVAYEAVCLNLFCFLKIIKQFCKVAGCDSIAKNINQILVSPQHALSFKSPIKMLETVVENNTYLKKTIATQVARVSNPTLKRTLLGLVRQTTVATVFKFVSNAIETFNSFRHEFVLPNLPTVSSNSKKDIRGNTSNSFCLEDEDPYFILQPLKIEKYLPEKSPDARNLTLVLDLDETLVHFTENESNGKFLVRPFAREFLIRLSQFFELVVFTAALKDYADWILDRIDTSGHIKYRLYRDHTTLQNGVYLKDLSRLNRDLSRMIIVDNNPDNFQMQPQNGIYIKSWYEDPSDMALKHLASLLIKVAESGDKDVRIALGNCNRKMGLQTKDNN